MPRQSSWINNKPDTSDAKTPLHIFVRHSADGQKRWVDIYIGQLKSYGSGIRTGRKAYNGDDRFMDRALKPVVPEGDELSYISAAEENAGIPVSKQLTNTIREASGWRVKYYRDELGSYQRNQLTRRTP